MMACDNALDWDLTSDGLLSAADIDELFEKVSDDYWVSSTEALELPYISQECLAVKRA